MLSHPWIFKVYSHVFSSSLGLSLGHTLCTTEHIFLCVCCVIQIHTDQLFYSLSQFYLCHLVEPNRTRNAVLFPYLDRRGPTYTFKHRLSSKAFVKPCLWGAVSTLQPLSHKRNVASISLLHFYFHGRHSGESEYSNCDYLYKPRTDLLNVQSFVTCSQRFSFIFSIIILFKNDTCWCLKFKISFIMAVSNVSTIVNHPQECVISVWCETIR